MIERRCKLGAWNRICVSLDRVYFPVVINFAPFLSALQIEILIEAVLMNLL